MTPKQDKILWIVAVIGALITVVICWFGAQLLREGIYHFVGTPTQQNQGHNAYETLALKQCEQQAQADAQKGVANVKPCSYPEAHRADGRMLLWGAIFLTIVSTIRPIFRKLRRFWGLVRGR